MAECCGRPCATPYCPLCGAAQSAVAPLHALLAYCRANGNRARNRVTAFERWANAGHNKS